jgi:hypothetical protein
MYLLPLLPAALLKGRWLISPSKETDQDIVCAPTTYTCVMSGSGGGGGYDYQADAIAYVAAHALAEVPLGWFEDSEDVVSAWEAETGGPGDDIAVTTLAGRRIEMQVKHRLRRGSDYNATFQRLFHGLRVHQELRAVLLIDRHSSEAIRNDLKTDISRIGQGRQDGLKQITLDLISQLQMEPDPALFARFRIVIVDLDQGSDGMAAAQSLLSRIVPERRAKTAYELLGKRGHTLIKTRGKDDTLRSARYLDGKIGLIPSSVLSTVSLARFFAFVQETNRRFYSPALRVQLDIGAAWSTVSPLESDTDAESNSTQSVGLEDELKRYQEWSRLARHRARRKEVEADLLLDSRQRLVIVGGPGSGKTTLSRKLAYLSSNHHVTLRVRLPTLTALLRKGETFEAALIETALDSSTLNRDDGRRIVNSAEVLIADGLDECDPDRAHVAAGLIQWGISHPGTNICVLTRAVGHSPALLPNFFHAELQPLQDSEIRKIATELISAVEQNESVRGPLIEQFIEAVKATDSRTAAAIAARNPLLLSFLIRLFLDHQPLTGNRSVLFSRIIELIRKSSPTDRRSIHGTTMRYGEAWEIAEILGWITIESPGRTAEELYHEITNRSEHNAIGLNAAEACVSFWEDRGLIERVSVGSRETIVFVHLSLGEYLAARFIARSGPDFVRSETIRLRRRAKWREPLLLAAGLSGGEEVIRTLVSLDEPDNPESTESVVAAACLAEAEKDSKPSLEAHDVADRLKLRLGSAVPLVSLEAGHALQMIAALVPELVGQIAVELGNHAQPWTRFSAVLPSLALDQTFISVDWIVHWLENFAGYVPERRQPANDAISSHIRALESAALPHALKRVASELPEEKARSIVFEFLKKAPISLDAYSHIRETLTEEPAKKWVEDAWTAMMTSTVSKSSWEGFSFEAFLNFPNRMRDAEDVLFKCVMEACGTADAETESDPHVEYPELSKLIGSMGLWEMGLGDLLVLTHTATPPLVAVISGIVEVLSLDKRFLGLEARLISNEPDEARRLFRAIRRDERPFPPERLASIRLDLPLLARALDSPSELGAWNAARLLEARTFDDPGKEIIRREFLAAGHQLRYFAVIAEQVWGEGAFSIVRERLSGDTSLIRGELFAPLLRLANTVEEEREALSYVLGELDAADPSLAALAAKALRDVEPERIREHTEAILRSLARWRESGSWCSSCKQVVMTYSCSRCHIVPPNPREEMLFLLAKAGSVTLSELLEIGEAKDSPERNVAVSRAASMAFEDDHSLESVINFVETRGAVHVLDALLVEFRQEMGRLAGSLKKLLRVAFPDVRARVTRSLAQRWVPLPEGLKLANEAIGDPDPAVRSAAVETLRELNRAEQ